MLVSLEQPLNAKKKPDFTPLPIVTLSRAVQLSNACWPTCVTLLGITILVRAEQPENADSPIFVTPSSITTFVIKAAYSIQGAV